MVFGLSRLRDEPGGEILPGRVRSLSGERLVEWDSSLLEITCMLPETLPGP